MATIHWKVPTMALVSLLSGVILAVGHHAFYYSLSGKPVDEALLTQQINNGAGTAFAFLVRHALAMAITISYWQMFWGALSRTRMSIDIVDSLAGLLTAIQEITNVKAMKAQPLLCSLAMLAWFLPFPAVITPGTLTVQSKPFPSTQFGAMPGLNLGGGKLSVVQVQAQNSANPRGGIQNYLMYTGPSQPLTRVLLATTIGGNLPGLPMPALNASYTLKFQAPTVKCNNTPSVILEGWAGVFGCSSFFDDKCWANSIYSYLSWIPRGDPTPKLPYTYVPFNNGSLNSSQLSNGVRGGKGLDLPLTSTDLLQSPYLQFGATTGVFVAARDVPAGNNYSQSSKASDWTVTQCMLYNSTLTVNFTFVNGEQTVRLLSRDLLNPVSPIKSAQSYDAHLNLVANSTEKLTFDYQAIMDSFGKLLFGSVYFSWDGGAIYLTEDSTSIFRTDVAFSKELYSIYNAAGYGSSISGNYSSSYKMPVADVLETLFLNTTLALFSEPLFKTNTSALSTDIFIIRMRNVYNYNSNRLWLAYGIQIGIASLVTLLGFVILFRNKASYSNKFSTILRTTRYASIDTHFSSSDTIGNDPLPKHIAQAKLQIVHRKQPSTRDVLETPSTRLKPGPTVMVEESEAMIEDQEAGDHESVNPPSRL